jgi:hypothetical protein
MQRRLHQTRFPVTPNQIAIKGELVIFVMRTQFEIESVLSETSFLMLAHSESL